MSSKKDRGRCATALRCFWGALTAWLSLDWVANCLTGSWWTSDGTIPANAGGGGATSAGGVTGATGCTGGSGGAAQRVGGFNTDGGTTGTRGGRGGAVAGTLGAPLATKLDGGFNARFGTNRERKDLMDIA